MSLPKVLIGIPCTQWSVTEGHVAAIMQASKQPIIERLKVQSYSWITKNFNDMWCCALNGRKAGVTHFLMLHDDIIPTDVFWLDKMLAIMEEHQADVLSAIVPIKDNNGFTSTALDQPPFEGAHDTRVTRLTLHEVFTKYPSTFTAPNILINTGLMLVDMRKPWVEECFFQFYDRIEKDDKGEFFPVGMPEDWLFSRQARNNGAKLFATRDVKLIHRGQQGFHNFNAWGKEKTDGPTA